MAKKNVSATIKSDNEFYKLIRIVLLLVILFGIFYGVTYFVTKNQKNTTDNSTEDKIAAIQYDKILVGTIFNQKRNEYYVLLDKQDSNDYTLYNSYATTYASKEKALKVFTVDMNDSFNKEFYGEESNITEELSEFKINKATLLKIKDGSIVEQYEGKDSIVNHMKELTK